jgi:hypothetical protein
MAGKTTDSMAFVMDFMAGEFRSVRTPRARCRARARAGRRAAALGRKPLLLGKPTHFGAPPPQNVSALSPSKRAGGISAAVSKTAAAPIERVKLLIQVRRPCAERSRAQRATSARGGGSRGAAASLSLSRSLSAALVGLFPRRRATLAPRAGSSWRGRPSSSTALGAQRGRWFPKTPAARARAPSEAPPPPCRPASRRRLSFEQDTQKKKKKMRLGRKRSHP